MLNSTGDTIGEILKRAREAKELSIEDVNRHTKISTQVINSLEQDDLEAFSSDTYLKGFLRSYATFLGLDPDQMWGMVNRKRGTVAAGKGTFWDIEEAVREEKLKSPKIFKRFIFPAMIIIIVVLAILLIMERRKAEDIKTGQTSHYVAECGHV
jgi:cytoskeletal protein RodZ